MGSTLEIMETLSGFGGLTVCYVNPDAISAGSFIAIACDKIFFSPKASWAPPRRSGRAAATSRSL